MGEEESERVLRRLELIDEEVAQYGSLLVKCDDHLMAKKFGHRSTPALVFFRHGKVLHFEGLCSATRTQRSLERHFSRLLVFCYSNRRPDG